MGTYYCDVLANEGHEDVAYDIFDAWQADEHDRAMALVGEHLLEDAISGTSEEARRSLETKRELDAVDAVSINFPRGVYRPDQGDDAETGT